MFDDYLVILHIVSGTLIVGPIQRHVGSMINFLIQQVEHVGSIDTSQCSQRLPTVHLKNKQVQPSTK